MRPSEAIKKGLCPSCLGRGATHKLLMGGMGECNTCEGAGVWPPPQALAHDDGGTIAIIYGETVAHRETCAMVKSQRRLMSERRAQRQTGPLFRSVAELNQLMTHRDPCDCGGIETEAISP